MSQSAEMADVRPDVLVVSAQAPDVASDAVSKARGGPKKARIFPCSYCPKVFTRSEHCSRHKLSHTNQRPFACRFCDRSYARKDLVRRHERTLHADLHNALLESTGSSRGNRPPDGDLNGYRVGNSNGNVAADVDRDANASSAGWIVEVEPRKHKVARKATSRTLCSTGIARSDEQSPRSQPGSPSSAASPASSGSSVLTRVRSNMSQSYSFPAPLSHPSGRTEFIGNAFDSSRNQCSGGDVQSAGQFQPSPRTDGCHYEYTNELILSPHESFTGARRPAQSSSIHTHREPSVSQFESTRTMPDGHYHSVSEQHLPPLPTGSAGNHVPTFDMSMDTELIGASDDFFFQQMIHQQNLWSAGNTILDGQMSLLDNANIDFAMDGSPFSPTRPYDRLDDTTNENTKRAHLPTILKEKSEAPPTLAIDELAYQSLCDDVRRRLEDIRVDIPIRNHRELQYLCNGYLACFHRHLPFLHLPSLDVGLTPSPLILALCCIGALYRLDRQKARKLYNLATSVLGARHDDINNDTPTLSETSQPAAGADQVEGIELEPLWSMQARTLLLLYAILGNDNKIVNAELSRLVAFVIDHRSRRGELESKCQDPPEASWYRWIEIESTKRYLCTIFICSSLLNLIYDLPPGLDITHDLEIELLDEEILWNAKNAAEWQALRKTTLLLSPTRTIREVMASMITDNSQAEMQPAPYCISGFTMLTIIHAVNMYTWSLSQLNFVHKPQKMDYPSSTSRELLMSTMGTLARCREVLHGASLESIESMWNSPEGPLLLNSEAMLRVAYTRLFQAGTMPHGMALFSNTSQQNSKILAQFVSTEHARSPLITKVMSSMCEALSVPAKAGYLLVQKTAAISWSVEHAVAGWGCVVLLSKWIHFLENLPNNQSVTDAEADIFSQVKSALEGMNIEYEEGTSLAATIVRTYAPLLVDVWVWGITSKMGHILQDLAPLYEANSRRTSPEINRINLHATTDPISTM